MVSKEFNNDLKKMCFFYKGKQISNIIKRQLTTK